MSVKTIKGSTAAAATLGAAFLACALATGCATQHVENPKPADGAQPGVCILEVAGQADSKEVAPVVYGDAEDCAKAFVKKLEERGLASEPVVGTARFFDGQGGAVVIKGALVAQRPVMPGREGSGMCFAVGDRLSVSALAHFNACGKMGTDLLLGTKAGRESGELSFWGTTPSGFLINGSLSL